MEKIIMIISIVILILQLYFLYNTIIQQKREKEHLEDEKEVNDIQLEIETLINEGLNTDGEHHKQWYLEQVAEILEINVEEHEKGISP